MQIWGYHKFCGADNPMQRPWCSSLLPNLYGFVQSHYWNNGLFAFWTLEHLPNFVTGDARAYVLVPLCLDPSECDYMCPLAQTSLLIVVHDGWVCKCPYLWLGIGWKDLPVAWFRVRDSKTSCGRHRAL